MCHSTKMYAPDMAGVAGKEGMGFSSVRFYSPRQGNTNRSLCCNKKAHLSKERNAK